MTYITIRSAPGDPATGRRLASLMRYDGHDAATRLGEGDIRNLVAAVDYLEEQVRMLTAPPPSAEPVVEYDDRD